MTTREKILVVAAAAAVLYGGWHWARLPGSARSVTVVPVGSGTGLRGVGAGSPVDLQPELHILRRIESEWAPDPFAVKPLAFGAASSGTDAAGGYVYAGCLEVGGVYVAFVNGLEYRVGDEIASSGYVVESIDRSSVVLRQRDGGGKITVPLSEEGVRKP